MDPITIRVQTSDFEFAQGYADMRAALGEQVGAIVGFVGLVRDRNPRAGDGTNVRSLTLEHYPGMTEKSMHKIAAAAHQRWPLLASQVVHRVGTLDPAEQIVMVLVASAHRDAAFAAAQYIMDYLKTDAVFWKRERSDSGTAWVESTGDDRVRRKGWES